MKNINALVLLVSASLPFFLAFPALADQQAPQPSPGFYYYCPSSKSYFPTVPQCPEGWIAIPVNAQPVQQPALVPVLIDPYPVSDEMVKTHPDVVSLEVFGRANAYSVNYDHSLGRYLSLGFGVSAYQVSPRWQNYQIAVGVLPVYLDYYFTQRPSRGYLTAGAEGIKVSQSGYNNDVYSNTGAAAVVGGGFEYRDASGFLMRISAYVVIGQSVDFNPGVSLGISF